MENILILSNVDLKRSSREYRQIKLFSLNYHVTAVGSVQSGFEHSFIIRRKLSFVVRLFRLIFLALRMYNKYYWNSSNKKLYNTLSKLNFDIIIAHELDANLPLAYKYKSKVNHNVKIVLDAHEYALDEYIEKAYWRLLFKPYILYLHDRYIRHVDKMFVVCDGIGELYNKDYSVRTITITNATDYYDITCKQTKDDVINLIHHGIASSSRKLENLIELIKLLDSRFHLYFMLVENNRFEKKYVSKLKQLSLGLPIIFIDPVAIKDIPNKLNEFDMEVIYFEPFKANYLYALSNKFFESIQGRIPIASGPSIEQKRYIQKYGIGVFSQEFSINSLAQELNKLTSKDIDLMKNQCDLHAKYLSSHYNNEQMLYIVKELLNK